MSFSFVKGKVGTKEEFSGKTVVFTVEHHRTLRQVFSAAET